jgi:tRNA nucleotidyltransferase (CCA-adding enzyme)
VPGELQGRLETELVALGLAPALLADALRDPAWLVGGIVRDALLGRGTADVDIVVEGDAPAAARRLAGRLAAPLRTHAPFGTASVAGADATVDLVTARRERYAAPGALPVVEPAELRDDLARRDFAVNALAVPLAPRLGALVDPHGGLADLRQRRLRVLHEGSFADDATRILRGVRYEARLGFRFDRRTEDLAREAARAGHVLAVGWDRLRDELLLVLAEHGAAAALVRLADLGVLRALDPALGVAPPTAAAIERTADLAAAHAPEARLPLARLGLLLAALPAERSAALLAALRLPARDRAAGAAAAAAPALADRLREADAAGIAAVLDRLPVEAAVAAAAHDAAVRPAVARFLAELRHVRLELTGTDLQRELGVPPSPLLGRLLAELRRRKLRGELATRVDELVAARGLLDAEREGASG